MLGGFLVAAGFGAMAFARTLPEVAVTVVVWTFGEMFLLPGMVNYVSEIAPAHKRGAYMGLYSMSFGTAFAAGPWLGSLILGHHGPAVLWPGVFAVGMISVLMFIRVRNPTPPRT